MKNIFLFCCLLCASHVLSQPLDDAFAKAKKQNKIVMILVKSAGCAQCNDVAEQGLSGAITQRAIAASAVLVKMDKLPEMVNDPYSLYFIPADFFGMIYADADRNLLQVYHGSSSFYRTYLDNLEKAIAEKERGTESMAALIADFYGKKGGFETSMKLIGKIMAVGLDPKDEVIDQLVHDAPADSANSVSFLQYVERAAPSIGSAAYLYTMRNNDNYNMSWWRMNNQERISINNRSYQKSLHKAISTKDMNLIYQVSAARQNMFRSSGPAVAQRVGMETLLQYYKGIKDTNTYLSRAPMYYDTYFMTVSVDSVRRSDSLKNPFLYRSPNDLQKQPSPGAVIVATKMVAVSPLASWYGNALNEGAWTFYTWSKNPVHLVKALVWARRSVDFIELPESMDTYARLLYITHNQASAIEWETKAIDALKARDRSTETYEKVLREMKKGADRIDAY